VALTGEGVMSSEVVDSVAWDSAGASHQIRARRKLQVSSTREIGALDLTPDLLAYGAGANPRPVRRRIPTKRSVDSG